MDSNNISSRVIHYIENNITKSLNLEIIAREMNYSKYHFHRMFLSEMGISVIGYIRKRRILKSAYRLLNSNNTITEIAYSQGFDNVDTFIRCFKKYYGVTPSIYRENIKLIEAYQKECGNMIDFAIELRECNNNDKKQAIKTLDKIIELSRVSHKMGLLGLEEYIKHEESPYLVKAIELLIDAVKPQQLRKILSNYIITSNLTPFKLLEHVLYLEGILLIQEGVYPWDIRKILSSYFGDSYIIELKEYYHNENNLKTILTKYEDMATEALETKLLDKELKSIDKRSMQRLLRDCDTIIISIAFIGASNNLKKLALNSLPKRRQDIFVEVIDLIGVPTISHIFDAQNEILRVAKELRVEKNIKY